MPALQHLRCQNNVRTTLVRPAGCRAPTPLNLPQNSAGASALVISEERSLASIVRAHVAVKERELKLAGLALLARSTVG